MVSLDSLRDRLAALSDAARAAWGDDEIAAASGAWNRYDRVRLRLTTLVEADFAGYVVLRSAEPDVRVPVAELTAEVDRLWAEVGAIVTVLDQTESDLYEAVADRSKPEIEAIDRRREQIASLGAGFEQWRSELRAEARVLALRLGPDPVPDDPPPPGPDEPPENVASDQGSAADPGMAAALGAAVLGIV